MTDAAGGAISARPGEDTDQALNERLFVRYEIVTARLQKGLLEAEPKNRRRIDKPLIAILRSWVSRYR